ncbi:protein GET4 [Impatiens glandulifera]|uniref:protein GET4 n=1 Tax=Impatiens glandulifera TaxID=253017 RepID=UPI001FB0E87A|nr:protein GET4 [Impatiens glandulifera]
MSRERAKKGVLPPAQEYIDKFEKMVREGDFYGAQQMYKSISARYASADRDAEALDVLHSGACVQLEHEQVTCGAELANLFTEALVKGKYQYDETTLERLRTIVKKFPRIPVPQNLDMPDDDDMQKLSEALGAAKTRVEVASSFLKAAIKWSAEFGAQKNGSPELHDMLAEYIYSESPEVDMNRVSYHFVRGKSPQEFASTLVNFTEKCYPGEDDLAIARAVLMYLSLGNLRDANYVMDEIEKQVKDKEQDFNDSELLHFVKYLLLTLERDALPLFNMLRQNYKAQFDREPTFYELLDEIATKFFGVQRKNSLQGMFGDIFKMMGGGEGM